MKYTWILNVENIKSKCRLIGYLNKSTCKIAVNLDHGNSSCIPQPFNVNTFIL
jgi:hypothetical protein